MGMVAIFLTIGFAVFAVISIRQEESDLIRQQEESNHVIATAVSNGLKTSMLAGKQDLTVQAIDSLKGIADVRQVRVFSLNGKESFGGSGVLTADAGDQLSRVLRSGERAEFYEDEGSSRVLTEIHPLPNEAACQVCHPDSGKLRGAILVSTSMERVDKAVWANKEYTVGALSLLLVLILGCLWAVLSKTIVKPLRSVVSAIKRIAAGDLTERVPAKSSDELGVLAVNFNDMTQSLSDLSTKIMETGEQTSSASAEISATVEQQASTSAEQSSAVAETTATIEELAGTARQIADTAKSVSRVADETSSHAKQGHEAVAATLEGMERINQKVNKVAEKTLSLGEKSQRVGTILEIINNIADQTNLLALNAAVEAARAGDQGRGFAVVAGEVRRLAEESVEATAKIKSLIDEIQAETNSTIMATEESAKEVGLGVSLANNAGQSLESILEVVAENTTAAKEISIATQQQKSASEQVVVAMTSISEASKQQASGAGQTAAATKQLNSAAAELLSAIAKFKVK